MAQAVDGKTGKKQSYMSRGEHVVHSYMHVDEISRATSLIVLCWRQRKESNINDTDAKVSV